MDILFCDLCNESVPQADLDGGRARRIRERLVCSRCDAAMSGESDGQDPKASETKGLTTSIDDTTVIQPPSELPARPVRVERSGAGAAVGVALASVALLFAAGAGAFLFDHIEKRSASAAAARESVRLEAAEREQRFEARLFERLDETSQPLSLLRGELEGLVERMDQLASDERASAAELRSELALLAETAGKIEGLEQTLTQQGSELSRVARTTADLHDEVVRMGGRLRESEEAERLAAQEPAAVAESGPEWMALVADLQSPNSGTRWQAVQSLGATADLAVAEHLTPMLKDRDIFVRMATARILGDLAAPIGIPALIDALEDPEAVVREASVVALRSITGRNFRFEPQRQGSRAIQAAEGMALLVEEGGGRVRQRVVPAGPSPARATKRSWPARVAVRSWEASLP